MNEIEIPKNLLPTGPVNLLPVAPKIDDGALAQSIDGLEQNFEELGLTKVGNRVVRLIHSLGVKTEGVGLLRLTRGYGAANLQMMTNAMIKLNEIIEKSTDEEKTAKASYAIGYLAGQLAKASSLMNKSEQDEREVGHLPPATPQRPSFAPGTVVYAQNVQMNTGTQPTETKPNP